MARGDARSGGRAWRGPRDDLKADQAFGKWCEGRFGDNALPKDERAILIQWGADAERDAPCVGEDSTADRSR